MTGIGEGAWLFSCTAIKSAAASSAKPRQRASTVQQGSRMLRSQVHVHTNGAAATDCGCPAAAGAARTSYHGVPRVLLSRPAEELRSDDSTSANCRGSAVAEETVPLDAAMAEFISRARINVSIRQVTGCDTAYQDA